jgi:hypothetical protein
MTRIGRIYRYFVRGNHPYPSVIANEVKQSGYYQPSPYCFAVPPRNDAGAGLWRYPFVIYYLLLVALRRKGDKPHPEIRLIRFLLAFETTA